MRGSERAPRTSPSQGLRAHAARRAGARAPGSRGDGEVYELRDEGLLRLFFGELVSDAGASRPRPQRDARGSRSRERSSGTSGRSMATWTVRVPRSSATGSSSWSGTQPGGPTSSSGSRLQADLGRLRRAESRDRAPVSSSAISRAVRLVADDRDRRRPRRDGSREASRGSFPERAARRSSARRRSPRRSPRRSRARAAAGS